MLARGRPLNWKRTLPKRKVEQSTMPKWVKLFLDSGAKDWGVQMAFARRAQHAVYLLHILFVTVLGVAMVCRAPRLSSKLNILICSVASSSLSEKLVYD